MLKAADTYIAAMAKKSSNPTGIVTVVDVEPAFSPRLIRMAYSAAAILLLQHFGVATVGQAVVLLYLYVALSLFVFCAPLAHGFCRAFWVVFAPRIMNFVGACFAATGQAIHSATVLVKVFQGLFAFAVAAHPPAVDIRPLRWPGNVLMLLGDHAGLAVKVKAIRLGSVLVKLIERLSLAAGLAKLHGTLSAGFYGKHTTIGIWM
jgi:hypothetical protein